MGAASFCAGVEHHGARMARGGTRTAHLYRRGAEAVLRERCRTDLLTVLDRNWTGEGDEVLRQSFVNRYPKYGNDDPTSTRLSRGRSTPLIRANVSLLSVI